MQLPSQNREPLTSRAGLILALYGSLALLALLISAGRDDIDIYRIAGRSTLLLLALSPLIGLAVGLSVVFLSRLAVHRFDWARRLHTDFRSILGPLSWREILVLALASSVGEELLFRGALQPMLGIWAQAAVFALLHIGPGLRFLPWTLSAFVLGLVFGWLFQLTGDLGGPIVAHFAINYMNLHFIARFEVPSPGHPRGAIGPVA
ncbi:MAG TPA: CPBP family intramembrane glutamic endopeptidase [Kofleriaceae bacterium]|nr:CPBP family intramembrane glutamic endopeptidase [Kofleriaceae bacterium]